MRRLVLDTIISLDGYYTSPKNEIDWFGFDLAEIEWSKKINRKADTMLYGRVTYQEFSKFWPTVSPEPDGFDAEIIGQLNGFKKVVFSSTLKEAPWQPAVIEHGDPVTAVAKLKRGEGKDLVIVGSGTLVGTLVRSGLVDEYRVRVRPIILGAGRPLFVDPNARHKLKLIEAKTFTNGVVALHYEPIS